MEVDSVDSVVSALEELGLPSLSYDDYDAVVGAEDSAALPRSSTKCDMENAFLRDVDDDDDDDAVDTYDSLTSKADFATAQLEEWLRVYESLAEKVPTSPSGTAVGGSAGTLSVEQVTSRQKLFTALTGIHKQWSRGIHMLVNRALATFLSTVPASNSARAYAARRALAFTKLYWTLLKICGFSFFQSDILRRSIAAVKRFIEYAAASAANGADVSKAKRSRGGAASSKMALPPTPEGVRRNPRRGASQKGAEGDAADADDVPFADDGMDDDDADDDDGEYGGRQGGGGAGKKGKGRKKGKGGGGGSGADDDRFMAFKEDDIEQLCLILRCLHSLLQGYSLFGNQEYIPLLAQLLVDACCLPLHIAPAHAPEEKHVAAAVAFLEGKRSSAGVHVLALVSACELALLDPQHTYPSLGGRVWLKRIKPFLLYGHAGTASAASGMKGAGMAGPLDGDGEDDIPGINLSKPAAPPDARTVRERALYLTRCLMSDGLHGLVKVTLSDEEPASVQPLPEHVLGRLPAVAALLQHLCLTTASENSADLRSVCAEIVAHLRAGLPHSLRRAFLRFLVRFGRSNKVSNRLVAVEVSSRLLGAGKRVTSAGVDISTLRFNADSAPAYLPAQGAGARTAAVDVDEEVEEDGVQFVSSSPAMSAANRLLDLALTELPVPTEADTMVESEGYPDDGVYRPEGAEKEGADTGAGGMGAPASPGGASASMGRSGGGRRTSIATMGSENSIGTPSGSLRAAGTPGSFKAGSTGGKKSAGSRGAGSPFYGRKSVGSMHGLAIDATQSEDGCADPRPTVTALLECILRRASDKSPVVRAKALSVLSDILDPSQASHAAQAKLLGLLVTHLSHSHILAAQAEAERGSKGGADDSMAGDGSEVTMHDITFGTAAAGGNALAAAFSAVASGSGVGFAQYSAPPPDGVELLIRKGALPLVPLLVRRMQDDKPAVRKAAVSAAVSLALSGAVDIIRATDLSAEGQEAQEGEGAGAWQDKHRAHDAVLRYAQALASQASTGALASSHLFTIRSIHGDDDRSSPVHLIGLYAVRELSLRATDPSTSVRQAAIKGMHQLLLGQPMSSTLQQWWLASVVPMVTDVEQSVSTTAVECIKECVIEPLLTWHVRQKKKDKAAAAGKAVANDADPTSFLPWMLLSVASAHEQLCTCLGRAMGFMGRVGERNTAVGTVARGAAGTFSLPVDKLVQALTYAAATLDPAPPATSASASATSPDTTALDVGMLGSASGKGSVADGPDSISAADYRRAAWLLLELLAIQASGVNPTGARLSVPAHGSTDTGAAVFSATVPFLMRSWNTMYNDLAGTTEESAVQSLTADAARLLRVFSLVPSCLDTKQSSMLTTSVCKGLQLFVWEPALVSAAVSAVSAVTASQSSSQGAVKDSCSQWWSPLQQRAELLLRDAAMPPPPAKAGAESSGKEGGAGLLDEDITTCLFTVGECALVALDPDAGNGLQDTTPQGDEKKKNERRLVPVSVSANLVKLAQVLMSPSAALRVSESVRAHAVLALGKLCLRDQTLAKLTLPVLIRDLHPASGTPAAVRNNCLFVLQDLCVRYTSLVDRHAIALAGAIADPEPMIRCHALQLLAQLVASDYLKWRAFLFYRFASALADDHPEVRAVARDCLMGSLFTKDRQILETHFVDLLFVLTGCSAHPAYAHLMATTGRKSSSSMTGAGSARGRGGSAAGGGVGRGGALGRAVGTYHAANDEDGDEAGEDIAGEEPASATAVATSQSIEALVLLDPLKRLHIYRTLLSSMPDEQKFKVHGKLAVDILQAVLDQRMRLTTRDELLKALDSSGRGSSSSGHRPGTILALTPKASARLRAPTATTAGAATSAGDLDSLRAAADAVAASGDGTIMLLCFPVGTTEALVSEVLTVLASPEMRVGGAGGGRGGAGKGAGEGGDAEGDMLAADAEDAAAVVAQRAEGVKRDLFRKISKKQTVENVVPIVTALKQAVQDQRSPLLGPLMAYLQGLFQDYGEDVKSK